MSLHIKEVLKSLAEILILKGAFIRYAKAYQSIFRLDAQKWVSRIINGNRKRLPFAILPPFAQLIYLDSP